LYSNGSWAAIVGDYMDVNMWHSKGYTSLTSKIIKDFCVIMCLEIMYRYE